MSTETPEEITARYQKTRQELKCIPTDECTRRLLNIVNSVSPTSCALANLTLDVRAIELRLEQGDVYRTLAEASDIIRALEARIAELEAHYKPVPIVDREPTS